MSGSPDDLARVAADLRAYLRQRRAEGLEWYLPPEGEAGSEGMGAAAAGAAAAAAVAGTPEPMQAPAATPATPPAASVTAPARPADLLASAPPAAAGAAPVASRRPAADPEFQRSCDIFVEQALAQLRRQATARPAAPRQHDFFTAALERDDASTRMSRAEKEAALAELSAQVAACTRCKLHASRTQGVFGVGDPDAGLVFIGEAPGREEDLKGEPFVGRAGKLLTDIMRAIGFEREQVYICNILKSRPPENRDPEPDEVEACEPFLQRQLQIIQPRLICCLGRVAAQNLLKTRASLGSLRDGVHFYQGVPVVVTYHPAALLRNPNWKRPTWDDVRRLRALHDALG